VEPDDPTVHARTPPEGGSSFERAPSRVLPVPGDRIGSFVLEEAIGAGGMGAVFRALDLRLDRHVALKLLPPEQSHDPEVVQRFYQEARAAARLDHENIARAYTIGHDGPHHFIAFEYIEGTNIRQRVAESGPLSVDESVNYTLQIAGALVHAASRGVVHRDIKPSNIIVTPLGRAKLVDMGLARRFERGASVDDGLTQSGMTLGTFDYISPEQARDPRDVDIRSDLYSLGCTLFHMLTGRPPFPEGTVLQKLLQHQAEPPPDVRSLNPTVPADLAAIVAKLMAKDRDRRYLSPEQLVRDLLTLAGSLGLRSVSPEGLVWLSAGAPPSWERHLVWGVPAFALALIVGFLVWWGQPGEPAATQPALPGPDLAASPLVTRPMATPPPEREVESAEPPGEGVAPPTAAPAPLHGEVGVHTSAELADALQQAASGAVIVLADDGPFELRPAPADEPDRPPAPRDLTLRAAPDARPVLRLAPTEVAATADRALLSFGPGHVQLEGLAFQLDEPRQDGTLAAVRADGTELVVRKCSFRVGGAQADAGRLAAIRLRAADAPTAQLERPLMTTIEECHFDGGQVALRAKGMLDAQIRDCTFGPSTLTFWLDNAGASPPVPGRLALRHASVVGGNGTVFRVNGSAASLRLDDSVVAPIRDAQVTLVATDDPGRLDWLGRGNLYSRIDTYLLPTKAGSSRAPIRRFDAWAEEAGHRREFDSAATLASVWARSDPASDLARTDPSPAFQLDAREAPTAEIGARRGPYGNLPGAGGFLAVASLPAEPILSARPEPNPPPTPEPDEPDPDETMPEPMIVALPPMERDTATGPGPPGRQDEVARPEQGLRDPFLNESVLGPARTAPAREAVPSRTSTPTAPGEIRTERALVEVLRRPEPPPEPLRLASGAEFILTTTPLRGAGRWVIRGPSEAGAPRPIIRFRPGMAENEAPLPWTALFRLLGSSLELQDVDVIIEPSPNHRWAAFAMGAGSDLNLIRCTVTLRGDAPRSAIVAVLRSGPRLLPRGARDAGVASFRATDSVLRCGSDLIDVAAGLRLDATLDNSVVATAGTLAHGHGSPRGEIPESLKLVLRQVSARTAGGLVRLESTTDGPELPLAEVVARDSILATTPGGGPLFRVDGQDDLERLRDRIRWEGHGVSYHQIGTYRRDQTSEPGAVPLRFDRPDWEVAVGPREDAAFHGELKFLNPWDDSRPLWGLVPEDMRLDPSSPARATSPDLGRIPTPPPG
jgi:serine/threonine-protein kinase